MSDIPADIEAAAFEAWTSVPTADWETKAVEVIARAILSERQRCARYARAYLEDLAGCDMAEDEPERIASGILTGGEFVPPEIELPGDDEE